MSAPYQQWVWVEMGPDGREGMITAHHPLIGGQIPLAHPNKELAEKQFGPMALMHATRTGHKVRLVRMMEVKE